MRKGTIPIIKISNTKTGGKIMRYSIGDIVEFRIGSTETDKGEVKFIEEDRNESTLYINGYSGWAYKIPEKKIVSRY
ncbi:MAG TPA: hypothetical protein VN316_01220 [candidate division Zixibacteria bacterium]|nr:hypothetical protein [candidate division Zixibacteria bacterium]